MTKLELLAALEGFPDDAEVIVNLNSGYGHSTFDIQSVYGENGDSHSVDFMSNTIYLEI